MKELTAEIKAELNGKTPRDRQGVLTRLNVEGYLIKPYLVELLLNSDGTDGGPEEEGFINTHFADMYSYHLNDGEVLHFQRDRMKGGFRYL